MDQHSVLWHLVVPLIPDLSTQWGMADNISIRRIIPGPWSRSRNDAPNADMYKICKMSFTFSF